LGENSPNLVTLLAAWVRLKSDRVNSIRQRMGAKHFSDAFLQLKLKGAAPESHGLTRKAFLSNEFLTTYMGMYLHTCAHLMAHP
jgi:hypothetical protein